MIDPDEVPGQCRGCGEAIIVGYNMIPGRVDRCQDCAPDVLVLSDDAAVWSPRDTVI